MNLPDIIKFVIDLLAVLLLALGIKGLSKVRSAREANILANHIDNNNANNAAITSPNPPGSNLIKCPGSFSP